MILPLNLIDSIISYNYTPEMSVLNRYYYSRYFINTTKIQQLYKKKCPSKNRLLKHFYYFSKKDIIRFFLRKLPMNKLEFLPEQIINYLRKNTLIKYILESRIPIQERDKLFVIRFLELDDISKLDLIHFIRHRCEY